MLFKKNRTLSHTAETKDFAHPTSHPVRGWTGKNKAFCSPGTQNGRRVIKVYGPRSIYQYSNIAPRLSVQKSIFGVVFFVSKSLLGTE